MPNNTPQEEQNQYPEVRIPTPEPEELREELLEDLAEREAQREEERVPTGREDRVEELKQRAAQVTLTPEEEQEAERHKAEVGALEKDAQVQRLLQIAEAKGVIFAVKVAAGLDDAYTIDRLHDVLAQDERYKDFLK